MNKFKLGEIDITTKVDDLCTENRGFNDFVFESFEKYIKCDWGDTCKEDATQNDYAVEHGERILAVYKHPDREDWRIWIITEWDRSVTTILFPSEFEKEKKHGH